LNPAYVHGASPAASRWRRRSPAPVPAGEPAIAARRRRALLRDRQQPSAPRGQAPSCWYRRWSSRPAASRSSRIAAPNVC